MRDAASAATDRASERERRAPRPLDPEVSAELVESLGSQRGVRLAERLAQASEALDRERFDEARRLSSAIVKEAPTVSAAHEVAGLALYRLGRYKAAVRELEVAQDLRSDPSLLPVIADSYRALRRWSAVERVWLRIREASPPHEVLAEGRIVAASALSDRGDLGAAVELMEPATKRPKRVRDHHLRQWYVLADLYDRMGDPINARRWFGAIADRDPEYSDVRDRLRAIGR